MRTDLNKKVIILTGAGGGIGSASVKLLVEYGAHVVCVDQNAEALQELAKGLPQDQITIIPIAVTDAASASSILAWMHLFICLLF
jgi:NADP-dependent 3-hydroxy acid dehydrogenase YdfG